MATNDTLAEHRLFAAGLGLWLSSEGALAGIDVKDGTSRQRPLMDAQELVMFRPGSPELDYRISLIPGDGVRRSHTRYVETAAFGWKITGGAIVIRDGYEPLALDALAPSTLRIPWPAGYYLTTVGWQRSARDSEMVLHFGLERTDQLIPGDGAVDLDFVVA